MQIISTPQGEAWTQMEQREWGNLDEIYAGLCDGMTYKEIEANFPQEASERKKDKLGYRYPRGESYLDVIQRLVSFDRGWGGGGVVVRKIIKRLFNQ
jgi:broad specificity phosphatase PhoE